jgi:hypothetical protein
MKHYEWMIEKWKEKKKFQFIEFYGVCDWSMFFHNALVANQNMVVDRG